MSWHWLRGMPELEQAQEAVDLNAEQNFLSYGGVALEQEGWVLGMNKVRNDMPAVALVMQQNNNKNPVKTSFRDMFSAPSMVIANRYFFIFFV